MRSPNSLRALFLGLAAGSLLATSVPAWAISRAEIVGGAPAFEEHAWHCGAENLTAACADGSWKPAITSVGPQVGLPYCWGGWVTIAQFDQQIAAGYGAGSLPTGLFLGCTTGVDCSGYVSQLWKHPHKLGTSTIPDVSYAIDTTQMQPGDVFNRANAHVIMYLGEEPNGTVLVTESTNASACLGVCRRTLTWSSLANYIPRVYMYTDTPSTPGAGTIDDPILIEAFPFQDARNTNDSESRVFDYYSAAPTTNESGPEFIYVFHAASGGTLTASVLDGPGVDIDIHLLSALSADACLARDDVKISYEITEPGTYYLVADTYVGSSGTEYAGAYLLNADFTGELVPLVPPDAGVEAGPDAPDAPAASDALATPDAALDALIETDAGTDASPGAFSTYENDGADGCACGVTTRSPWHGGMMSFLLIALWTLRRRATSNPPGEPMSSPPRSAPPSP